MALMLFIWGGLGLLLWPIAWKDYHHWRLDSKKGGYPVVTGQVIDRHMTPYCMSFRRPLLMIQPDGTNVTVHALLIRNKLFDFPNRISFHYSGDAEEEVLLTGESDPRAAALFMAAFPIALPAFLVGLFFYGQRTKKLESRL